MSRVELSGARVLVMGLGAHGGGEATARYCFSHGADVTVTDLRGEDALSRGLAGLADLPIRFVLGRHDEEDFRAADLVIKNPAVPRSSGYLALASRIETDISLFMKSFSGPLIGVTGTKGKSSVATAIHGILARKEPGSRLGGNITRSPLTFLDELEETDPVVLELSSFQLGDLLLAQQPPAASLPRLSVAVVTNLLPDHQNYYNSMEVYAQDKEIIFSRQSQSDSVVLSIDDSYSRAFAPPFAQNTYRVTSGSLPEQQRTGGFRDSRGFLRAQGSAEPVHLVPDTLLVPGRHQRTNMLFAGAAAYLFGVDELTVRESLQEFRGVPHRLEVVALADGITYVNDSAATIAEATLAAVESFEAPLHLIAGGSDKGLPMELFSTIAGKCASLHLLAGSATERIAAVVAPGKTLQTGPHDSLEAATDAARASARPGDVILLSPGCASFGMFANEFDRGDQFRRLCAGLKR